MEQSVNSSVQVTTNDQAKTSNPLPNSPKSPIAYYRGQWLPENSVGLSLHDWGCLQGATLVERLRTSHGELFALEGHLRRLEKAAETIGIEWPLAGPPLEELCQQCVLRNREAWPHEPELSLVIMLTPGIAPSMWTGGEEFPSGPTLILHCAPLPWKRLAKFYRNGQEIVVAPSRNIPPQCWPPHIKSRSRLHYYLADYFAHSISSDTAPLLLNIDGTVAETSTSNVLVAMEPGTLISPPLNVVLPGISLDRIDHLSQKLGWKMEYRPISLSEIYEADEVILTGTTPGVWSAVAIDGRPIGSGKPGRMAKKLMQAWTEDTGLDMQQQAFQQAGL